MTKPTLIQVIKSVLSAFIGIQSDKNRQFDFNQGAIKDYIIVGLIATVLLVSMIIFLVSLVI
ncbi:MAG: hypothetical protein RL637_429 [Pseudomonadota bacterium]|jgi:hypothetical protein